MKKYSLYNNKIIESSSLVINTDDRMFRLGDGTFQTIKIVNYKPYNLDSHLSRLQESAQTLNITHNFDNHLIKNNFIELIKLNNIKNGTLRVALSRGSGSAGYLPINNIESSLYVTCSSPTVIERSEINVGVSKYSAWQLPLNYCRVKNCKSQNYIQVKIEAAKSELYDNVILTDKGYISETSSCNIFWIKNERIYTPDITTYIYPGIIRSKILEIINDVSIGQFTIQDLINSDEIFLCNSNLLLLPVDNFFYDNEFYKKTSEVSSAIKDKLIENVEQYCAI